MQETEPAALFEYKRIFSRTSFKLIFVKSLLNVVATCYSQQLSVGLLRSPSPHSRRVLLWVEEYSIATCFYLP